MKLRIPTLLAAVIAAASFLYLADTRDLAAGPLVKIQTLAGQALDLADPAGRTRLVSFWAPDCPISERNVAAISQMHQQFNEDALDIVAIAMPYSKQTEIDSYISDNKVDYPVAFDQSGVVSDAFPGVRFTPTTFLIDGQGTIVWKHIGRMTASETARRINSALTPQQLAKR